MKYILSTLLIHFCLLSFGQITFTKIPIDLQLVARDLATNKGTVKIEGSYSNQSITYNKIRVDIYRNNIFQISNWTTDLIYNNSNAPFAFNILIAAELAQYTFKIYGYKNISFSSTLLKTVNNVVAGDVYIIQGQSNAEAYSRNGSANSNKSDYIRVYANGTDVYSNLASNNSWYIADGDVDKNSNGNAGQWGLKLARILVDNLQIPIAIFNGAHGGMSINFFKAPTDYKTSLSSNYGRMYYRLNQTGLKNNVRAVLWSQGEANSFSSFLSITDYKKDFKTLENSWLTDFPSIEKFYIFQTKDCDCGTVAEGRMLVKEAQRQLAIENNEIVIMPTTGLTLFSDNCHFPFTNGYDSFANRINKLVLHDIYNKTFTEEIKAPMIKSVEFIAPNSLVLETDAVILKYSSTDQTTMLAKLKQDYQINNAQNAVITAVALSGNKIIFTLSSDPGYFANISFIGLNSNLGYTITNSSNLELISFRNYLINNLTTSIPIGGGIGIEKPEIITISNGKKINIKSGATINLRGLILIPSVDYSIEKNISKSTLSISIE